MRTYDIRKFTQATQENKLPETPQKMKPEAIEFIINMVNDELQELVESTDVHEQMDALVDAIYYIQDTAVRHGMDLTPMIEIVHNANMQKVVDGKVIRRKDGKIMKPDGWVDPAPLLIEEVKRQENEGSWARYS